MDREFPNGELRVHGLIGDPVAQVRAPAPMTERLRQAGLNAALVRFHVPSQVLPSVIDSPKLVGNLDGLVITGPHKIPNGLA